MDKIVIGSKFRGLISACTWFHVLLVLSLGRIVCFFAGRNRKPVKDLKKIKSVLVLRMDRIGDTVLAVPFLRELRRNLPQAHISVMTSSMAYNLLEGCPYVDALINTGAIAEKFYRSLIPPLESLIIAKKHLRKKKYDLTLVPRWDVDLTESSFLAYFSGAPWRVGYSENVIDSKSWSNAGYNQLFTDTLDDHSLKHEVERGSEILRFLGAEIAEERLELWATEQDCLTMDRFIESLGITDPNTKLINIFAGAATQKRIWPEERYQELIEWLVKYYPCKIFILGGEKEKKLGDKFEQSFGSQVKNLTGRLTLRQAYVLLKKSHLYVGSDTGMMHIAAAANIPVVEISCHPKSGFRLSGNAPERFRPWCEKYKVLQPEQPLSPCVNQCGSGMSHCICQITFAQVRDAVRTLIS